MTEWIDVLSSDSDDAPLPDDVIYKDYTDYIIEVLMGGSIGHEEIKTIKATYIEAADTFVGEDSELYCPYDIWRYTESEDE